MVNRGDTTSPIGSSLSIPWIEDPREGAKPRVGRLGVSAWETRGLRQNRLDADVQAAARFASGQQRNGRREHTGVEVPRIEAHRVGFCLRPTASLLECRRLQQNLGLARRTAW
jgi:hypothetical protein